jgi:hypothetical protein
MMSEKRRKRENDENNENKKTTAQNIQRDERASIRAYIRAKWEESQEEEEEKEKKEPIIATPEPEQIKYNEYLDRDIGPIKIEEFGITNKYSIPTDDESYENTNDIGNTDLTTDQKINLIVACEYVREIFPIKGDLSQVDIRRYSVGERLASYRSDVDVDDYFTPTSNPITYNVAKYLLAHSTPLYAENASNGRFRRFVNSENEEKGEFDEKFGLGGKDITSMVIKELANAKYLHKNLLEWPVKVMCDEGINVYSGIGHSGNLFTSLIDLLPSLTPDSEPIHFPFFMSTSFVLDVALKFATQDENVDNIIFKIKLNSGQPLTYISKDLDEGEREILINSGMRLKFITSETKTLTGKYLEGIEGPKDRYGNIINGLTGNPGKELNYVIYEFEILDDYDEFNYNEILDDVLPNLLDELTTEKTRPEGYSTQSILSQEYGGKKTKKHKYTNNLKSRKNIRTNKRNNNNKKTRKRNKNNKNKNKKN